MNYNTIKSNYDKGLFSKAMVKVAVKKGIITAEQYRTITGDEYTA